MAEMRVGLVSDDNVLFELWYRYAPSLGYKPEDFSFVVGLMRSGQETWTKHVYYAELHGLPVLSESEYLWYFLKEHASRELQSLDNNSVTEI